MSETSVIQCKICKEIKTRVLAGKWGNCKKWVDTEGKLFNGKTCPNCVKSRCKEDMRKLRSIKKEAEENVNAKISNDT